MNGKIYVDRIQLDGVLVPTGTEELSADGDVTRLANSIVIDTSGGSIWAYLPDVSLCTWPVAVVHAAGALDAEIHPNSPSQGIGEVAGVLTLAPGEALFLVPVASTLTWKVAPAL